MKTIEWQYLIVSYLFLGGLSAGLFFISAVAELLPKNKEETAYTKIARYGALFAPWPVMIGCATLVFDLGHWYRFYKLFLHFRWESPMSIGSWLLLVFTCIALIHAYAWLPSERRRAFFAEFPAQVKFLRAFDRDLSGWRRPLSALGLPISIGVAIYTGVLLGAVQSRPFWNTNLVAQLFLFSALSTGCALLLLILATSERKFDLYQFRLLYLLDVCFLTLEFFIVVPYIIHGELSIQAVRDSLKLILGGPFTVVFWVFFIGFGLLLPWAIEIREILPLLFARSQFAAPPDGEPGEELEATNLDSSAAAVSSHAMALHFSRIWAVAASVLVLAGGVLVRYVFVFAGQMSSFR